MKVMKLFKFGYFSIILIHLYFFDSFIIFVNDLFNYLLIILFNFLMKKLKWKFSGYDFTPKRPDPFNNSTPGGNWRPQYNDNSDKKLNFAK